jgi:hypothetical protein
MGMRWDSAISTINAPAQKVEADIHFSYHRGLVSELPSLRAAVLFSCRSVGVGTNGSKGHAAAKDLRRLNVR